MKLLALTLPSLLQLALLGLTGPPLHAALGQVPGWIDKQDGPAPT